MSGGSFTLPKQPGCGLGGQGGVGGARVQDQWRQRRLIEVEVLRQVAQQRQALPYHGPRVRAAVGRRVEAGAARGGVLTELFLGIKRQRLGVGEAPPCVWGGNQSRYPGSQ